MDFSVANYLMSKENSSVDVISPTKDDYKKHLAESLLNNNGQKQSRILAFKHKPPPPPEGFVNGRATLYSQNVASSAQTKPKKMFRHIPQAPERTLDAPDMLDDYYLNLLDWSSSNVLAVALGMTVYLWDATTSSIEELMTVEEEGPITSVSWAPDGQYLAVGLNNSTVQLWDSTSLRQVHAWWPCVLPLVAWWFWITLIWALCSGLNMITICNGLESLWLSDMLTIGLWLMHRCSTWRPFVVSLKLCDFGLHAGLSFGLSFGLHYFGAEHDTECRCCSWGHWGATPLVSVPWPGTGQPWRLAGVTTWFWTTMWGSGTMSLGLWLPTNRRCAGWSGRPRANSSQAVAMITCCTSGMQLLLLQLMPVRFTALTSTRLLWRHWRGVPSKATCLHQAVVLLIGASSSGTPTLVPVWIALTHDPRCALFSGASMRRRFWAHMGSARTSFVCGSTLPWWRWLNLLATLQGCCIWLRLVIVMLALLTDLFFCSA